MSEVFTCLQIQEQPVDAASWTRNVTECFIGPRLSFALDSLSSGKLCLVQWEQLPSDAFPRRQ